MRRQVQKEAKVAAGGRRGPRRRGLPGRRRRRRRTVRTVARAACRAGPRAAEAGRRPAARLPAPPHRAARLAESAAGQGDPSVGHQQGRRGVGRDSGDSRGALGRGACRPRPMLRVPPTRARRRRARPDRAPESLPRAAAELAPSVPARLPRRLGLCCSRCLSSVYNAASILVLIFVAMFLAIGLNPRGDRLAFWGLHAASRSQWSR